MRLLNNKMTTNDTAIESIALKTVYDLEFEETLWKGCFGTKRVAGGWVHMFHDEKIDTITSSVFVPYSEEFKNK